MYWLFGVLVLIVLVLLVFVALRRRSGRRLGPGDQQAIRNKPILGASGPAFRDAQVDEAPGTPPLGPRERPHDDDL